MKPRLTLQSIEVSKGCTCGFAPAVLTSTLGIHMFRKILALLGIRSALASPAQGAVAPTPYKAPEVNFIYNLLFCDDLALFKPKDSSDLAYWQTVFFGPKQDAETIRKIAEDQGEESRIRVLAYNWLRANKLSVPPRQLLGVIVEVPLEGGLDVIAAYPDGRVRYINQTGKLAVFEGGPAEVEQQAKALVSSALPAVDRIGPWDKKRLPPPKKGNVRMTFLVSDGLYFGEGPFGQMQREPMAAPIIQNAGELLQLVVNAATK